MSEADSQTGEGCVGRELLEYQRAWVNDQSRFKIGLWARQTGKDFATTAEAVFQSHIHPRSTWVIVAAGERQALESLEKAKEWVETLKGSIELCTENRETTGAVLNSAEIVLGNKSRIIALPSRPETVRGYSANVILTEFAFHDDPTAIWRALFPSISNPLRGGPKRLRVISTPNGPGDKFHELWTKTDERYVKHRVTIHDAVARGLTLDVEELRKGLNDPDGWAQEYECEFLDSGGVLLPYELIEGCEDVEATEIRPIGPRGPMVCGIDFGRKHDRTVCWTFEKVGDVFWTREVVVLEKMATPEQVEVLRPRLAAVQRVCLDYTGAGVGLGDYLADEFGLFDPMQHRFGKVELCSFTAGLKAELFSKLRMAFEKRAVRVPVSPEIREDLHAVRRVVSRHGQVTYRATQNEDGHSDRCTALALALRAAGEARPQAASAPVILRNRLMGRAPRRYQSQHA
jgi:phage FluMu gp28-like protein